ncbi:zwei Ig domain protein zig-8-like [Penaeus monodon]|uniref:zwei Ig domain protein zig-8-like n=1 Tax=Penaeus monodon TaxID=6687 RepID=UPI0018A7737B|nr:zwei Ig domain protein zig-8-like [Penaeus monodon]
MERLPIPAQESMDVANVAAHATPPSCRTRPYSLWIFVLVAVNLFVAAECHIRGGHGPHMDVHRGTVSPPPSPQFDPSHSADVTALAGTTAILNCRVHNIKNHTVSWIRHRDIHLLTVGSYTYTSDQRFRALHMDDSDDWVLKIKFVQIRDSGIYECQISTTPPVSHFIRLKVVKPYTHVLGGPDMYINKGLRSTPPAWRIFPPNPQIYIISYDSDRGGVTVIIEKGDVTTSSLLIQDARPADSGRYDCNPSNASPANLTVHVLNGEHPAAMQHGGQGTYTSSSLRNILSLLSVLAALHRVLQ